MALIASQLQSLKTDIATNSNTPNDGSVYASTPINQIPNNDDGNSAIAFWYSQPASPTFNVYNTAIPVQSIYDAVTWANLTPTDVPDGTQTWANRSLACQGKQFNLQTILIGAQGVLNGAKANIRAGLQDALTGIPSGVAGATVAAGWVAVRDTVLARTALRIEKLLATTTVQQDGTTAAKAATLTAEGAIDRAVVSAARNLP